MYITIMAALLFFIGGWLLGTILAKRNIAKDAELNKHMVLYRQLTTDGKRWVNALTTGRVAHEDRKFYKKR